MKRVWSSVTRLFWSCQSLDKWKKARPMYYFHMVSQTLSTCYWHDFFPNTKRSFTEPLKCLCNLSYGKKKTFWNDFVWNTFVICRLSIEGDNVMGFLYCGGWSFLLDLILAFSQDTTYNVNHALMRHVSTRSSYRQATLIISFVIPVVFIIKLDINIRGGPR